MDQSSSPSAPLCYSCKHRRDLPGEYHSRCANLSAQVTGHEHGIAKGWFWWPVNFDPVWLLTCDGFAPRVDGEGELAIDT